MAEGKSKSRTMIGKEESRDGNVRQGLDNVANMSGVLEIPRPSDKKGTLTTQQIIKRGVQDQRDKRICTDMRTLVSYCIVIRRLQAMSSLNRSDIKRNAIGKKCVEAPTMAMMKSQTRLKMHLQKLDRRLGVLEDKVRIYEMLKDLQTDTSGCLKEREQ
ncbi:uncharacterized protein LOC134236675 [Saccostrea cucullata]|uniref:uncharacterized protein LOC134236675 n=1 Tax=Saccostrea cuccullata TaxID=36930 RepID=UPI002ED559A8